MTRMHLPQVLADAKTVQCVAERSALVAWFVICIADNKNARGKRRDGCSPRVVSFITVSSKLVSVVAQVLVCANMKISGPFHCLSAHSHCRVVRFESAAGETARSCPPNDLTPCDLFYLSLEA